jgi:hypothetical protein
VVLFYFLKELNFPTRRKSFLNTIVDNDDIYFPIGYVIDQPIKKIAVKQPTQEYTKPVKARIPPKQATIKPDNKFSEEAVSGLVGLGFKKREAQKVVERVIKEHNPPSLEELIRKCFAR